MCELGRTVLSAAEHRIEFVYGLFRFSQQQQHARSIDIDTLPEARISLYQRQCRFDRRDGIR